MNYEDEDYVRFYTRDTVSWRALGWEGQAVLALMLHGKFDRSGVFDCDGHDPSHAVTIVTGLPVDVTVTGLKRLLDSKTWVERDGKLVWPNFVHAQTCRRSDKARQRESREKRRAEALGHSVTSRDGESQAVTAEPSKVTNVSLSLAEQSRAEDPPTPLGPVTDGQRRQDPFADSLTGNTPERRLDVAQVHERWRETVGKPRHRFRAPFDEGAKAIAVAIDADGLESCLIVAGFCMHDGMVNGKLDDKRQKHDSLEYIFGKSHVFHRILEAALAAGKGGPSKRKLSAAEAVAAAKAT